MRWHWGQHTPSTAYTQDCLSSLHSHDYELTPEGSFTFGHASVYNWLLSASSPRALKGKVALSHSHGCKLTNFWTDSQHLARRPSTASQYLSKLARLRPPRLHNQGLQIHPHTSSFTISECISKLTLSRPPSVFPNMLDYGLQAYLQTPLVTVSKVARSRPPSVSPNSLTYSLQVRTIVTSKCISKLIWSQPPSVSLSSLDSHFQAHFELLSRTARSQSRYIVCWWVAI